MYSRYVLIAGPNDGPDPQPPCPKVPDLPQGGLPGDTGTDTD